MSLFKLSMVAFGLLVGSSWPHVFVGWRDVFLVLFIAPALCVTYLWFKQL